MTTPDQASPRRAGNTAHLLSAPRPGNLGSCVRCGRHACPDCLRSAAVGQQCVDCVRDAGQGTRQPRTVFGGRPAAAAVVTWTLIGLNVLLFLVELAQPSIANDWALLGYARVGSGGRCRASPPASGTG